MIIFFFSFLFTLELGTLAFGGEMSEITVLLGIELIKLVFGLFITLSAILHKLASALCS